MKKWRNNHRIEVFSIAAPEGLADHWCEVVMTSRRLMAGPTIQKRQRAFMLRDNVSTELLNQMCDTGLILFEVDGTRYSYVKHYLLPVRFRTVNGELQRFDLKTGVWGWVKASSQSVPEYLEFRNSMDLPEFIEQDIRYGRVEKILDHP